MIRFACATLSILALTACTAPRPPAAGLPIPVNAGAGPGKSHPSPTLAAEIFAKVCIETAPGFQGAIPALANYPMVQNATTGTYYNRFENLSVKLFDGKCSLVFGSPAGPKAVIPELASGTVKALGKRPPPGIDITSRAAPDGLRYFRMVIGQ